MKVKVLRTYGDGRFVEEDWNKPEPSENEIEVKALLTGVCRSDIDMMVGKFPTLPVHMSGHEGLGIVTKVGSKLSFVKEGDIVATRGEPAYADYYNVKQDEFITVPDVNPKYILEPVACGINCVIHAHTEIEKRQYSNCLILGSGFLAWVVYNKLRYDFPNLLVDVLGTNNTALWGSKLMLGTSDHYDIIIDLSGKYQLGNEITINNNAVVIDAVGKSLSSEEAQTLLWKAVTTLRPSPRTDTFIDAMYRARWLIENEYLEVDNFWTKCYNRNTNWKQAFTDGLNRPEGYSRGYIRWD